MSTPHLDPSDDARWIADALRDALEEAFSFDSEYHHHRWQPGPLVTNSPVHGLRIVLVCPCGKMQLAEVPE